MSLGDLKEKIKDAPVSSIVGYYIPLKRSGLNLLGLCPFHSDSKPSLTVSDQKGLYKCFACDAGGDAITFVEKYKNFSFIEALEECSKILGIPFEEYKKEEKKSPKTMMAEKILFRASQLYKKTSESPQSKESFQEFLQNRGLNEATAEQFSIGFVGNSNSVSHYLESIADLKERQLALSVALQLGLIKEKNQSHYDTFRNRVMFPIWDQMGKVVGFGGRALTNEQQPKYLNSLESFHFNKRNILYGLHLAKQEIRNRDSVILVEGYMDMISLYHHGFKNTVAVMGVALSDYAINRLKSITKNFYLALDSDSAGLKAAERMNRDLLKAGILAKYLDFKPHKDPDDFVRKEGSVVLNQRIVEAKLMIDVVIEGLVPAKIPEISSQKIELLNSCFELLSPLGESLEAFERLITFAKKVEINSNQDYLLEAYKEHLQKSKDSQKRAPLKAELKIVQDLESTQQATSEDIRPSPQAYGINKQEKILLEHILLHPELLTHPKIAELLDFVHNPEVKTFVLRLRELAYEIDSAHYESFITTLLGHEEFSTEIREAVAANLFKFQKNELSEKVRDRLIFDIERRIYGEYLKEKKQFLKAKQKEVKTEVELNALMSEILTIEKEITQIKYKKNAFRPTL
jgi:DNA primase